jgi:hypothetical protein
MALKLLTEHWEKGIGTIVLLLLSRTEYRIGQLEKKPMCPTLVECSEKMLASEKINESRFSAGVREFDGLAGAIRETNKILESRFQSIDEKYDRIIDHLLEIKHDTGAES